MNNKILFELNIDALKIDREIQETIKSLKNFPKQCVVDKKGFTRWHYKENLFFLKKKEQRIELNISNLLEK